MNRRLDQAGRNLADGFGSPPIGGFNALVPELDVADLGLSLAFWRDLLGFNVAFGRDAAGLVYLEKNGAQIMLCAVNGEWATGPLEAPFGRGVNFQITTPDVDGLAARIEAAGRPLFRAVAETVYQVGDRRLRSREFLVQDPDGYLIRFSQTIDG